MRFTSNPPESPFVITREEATNLIDVFVQKAPKHTGQDNTVLLELLFLINHHCPHLLAYLHESDAYEALSSTIAPWRYIRDP